MASSIMMLALASALLVATVDSQGFDYFGGYTSFSAPRDPRANTGPVTFPRTPIGPETSGVRVGASGYGFVPPGFRGGNSYGAGPNGAASYNYW